MKRILIILLLFRAGLASAQDNISMLPTWKKTEEPGNKKDWLLNSNNNIAQVYQSEDHKDIILDNGLLKRSFRLQPNLACFDFSNLSSGEQLMRAMEPEAQLIINRKKYNVGGLHGQKERAYLLMQDLVSLTADKNDFQFKSYRISAILPHVNWKSTRWAANKQQPAGKMLSLDFESQIPALKGITVNVNYELYDGIPLI